jgi:hypothetical protein
MDMEEYNGEFWRSWKFVTTVKIDHETMKKGRNSKFQNIQNKLFLKDLTHLWVNSYSTCSLPINFVILSSIYIP